LQFLFQTRGKNLQFLIKGARQVGKTYIIDQFARENYQNYIYINFELMPEYKKIFEGNLDFETLHLNLEVNFPTVKIEKGRTLLFLDEIQSCPNARTTLKSFALDGTLDVVASGSLLGLYYKEVSSYPVGYERAVELFPLDFVLNIAGQATALEVSSGRTRLAKSLISIIDNYKTVTRYIMLESGNEIYRDEKAIEHYPLL